MRLRLAVAKRMLPLRCQSPWQVLPIRSLACCYVTHHLSLCRRCKAEQLIMVGDRYLTDVVFGNRNGMLTIRPAPFTSRGEPKAVLLVRLVLALCAWIAHSGFAGRSDLTSAC